MLSTFLECSQISGVFYHSEIHGFGFLIFFMIQILRAQNNKTCFFYVLYSDDGVFDQSERAQGPRYIIFRHIIHGKPLAFILMAGQQVG